MEGNKRIEAKDFLGMGVSNIGETVARNHHKILVDMIDEFFRSGTMTTDGVLILSRSSTEKAIKILSERELSESAVTFLRRELMSG